MHLFIKSMRILVDPLNFFSVLSFSHGVSLSSLKLLGDMFSYGLKGFLHHLSLLKVSIPPDFLFLVSFDGPLELFVSLTKLYAQ